jgi:ferrous iron transport protein B
MSSGEDAPIPKVALVGHPNVGKTTLFNALTGERRKVGNYPGITVEKVSATIYTPHGNQIELVDLPGAYSLTPDSPDEAVTRDVLLGDLDGEGQPDLVICVLDAASLERHLYMAVQVMDLGLPVLLALNQVDRAEGSGLRINPQVLSDEFDVPVVACEATGGRGIVQLKQALRFPLPPPATRQWKANSTIEHTLSALARKLEDLGVDRPEAHALQLLSETNYRVEPQAHIRREAQLAAREAAAGCIASDLVPEEIISKARFLAIRRACSASTHEAGDLGEDLSDKIDRMVLHPVGGWVVFGGIMFAVFWTLFSLAKWPMEFIETAIGALRSGVGTLLSEGDLKDLILDGVIEGVGSVVIFLPQIVLLFFLIGLLEGSGYMARAAFLMDKVMARVGLSGKSFLPLLSGYACAIPGVMATRTINSAKQRLVTILVLPWQSCTARLPVYAILIPLLIPSVAGQTAMMFLVYFLGTGTALGAAWVLSKRVGSNEPPPQFLLELPPYRLPDFGYVLRHVLDRAIAFLKRAGTLILGISILLWALAAFPKAPSGAAEDQFSHSIMGRVGQVIEPVVRPLGWDARVGTAALASFAAREVFRSQIAISYAVDEDDQSALHETLRAATKPDGSPLYPPVTILSILVFFVYALQCLPTTVVVQRETRSWRWALGQLAGMSLFAYLAALLVFQIGSLFS